MVKENIEILFSKFYKEFKIFKKDMGVVKDDVAELKDKIDNHTLALLNIENTNQIYADMYQINKEDIKDLNRRVTVLETK